MVSRVPPVGLHVFHHGAKGGAVRGLVYPARPRDVRDFEGGALRYIRSQIVQHHAYVNLLWVRHVFPRNFPGKNLPDNDPEAVDVAGIGASSRVEHL